MNANRRSATLRRAIVIGSLALLACAPGDPRDAASALPTLDDVRRLASMVPGDAPIDVNALILTRFSRPASSIAAGASDDSIAAARPVFQVRFASDWIMVDAGLGPEFDPAGLSPTPEDYALLQEALRGARLVVFTHEHLDHVAGVVRSPFREELTRNALFTRPQLDGLVRQDPESLIRLEQADADRFVALDYGPIAPVAPGVVLIAAPGHTPGSQMIYVRLASGVELVFAGDVSNLWAAVEAGWQKPRREDLAEDQDQIAVQMAWLREAHGAGVHVVLAHDGALIDRLIDEGIIGARLDLTSLSDSAAAQVGRE